MDHPMLHIQGYELIIQACLLAVLLLVVVLGNSVICAIVWKFKNLRTHANFLVVEMAVTDLMNGMINIPLFICYEVFPSPTLRGRTTAIICLFIRRSYLIQNVLSASIIFTDRFLALAYGLRYTAWKSRRAIFIVIAVKWLIGLGLVGAVILNHTDFEEMGDAPIFEYIQQYEDDGIMPFPRIVLPGFIVGFCVISFLSTREIKKTVMFRKGLQGLKLKRSQDLKALKTVRYITCCYAICILPGVTRSVLVETSVKISQDWLLFFEFYFLLVTCAVNCIFYYARTQRFRRALVLLFIKPLEKNKMLLEMKTYDKVNIPGLFKEAKTLDQLEFPTMIIKPTQQAFTTVNKRNPESRDVASGETEESVNLPDDDGPSCWDTKL